MTDKIDFAQEIKVLKDKVREELGAAEETATIIIDQATEEVWENLGEEAVAKMGNATLLRYIKDMVGLIVEDIIREEKEGTKVSEALDLQAVFARIFKSDQSRERGSTLSDEAVPVDINEAAGDDIETVIERGLSRREIN